MRHKALLLAAAAALAAIPALTPATAEPAPGGAAVRGDTIQGAVMVQYYAYPGDPDYGYGGPGLLDVPDEVILEQPVWWAMFLEVRSMLAATRARKS